MVSIEDVWPEFSFLLNHGMIPADGRINSGGFRNAFLVLQGRHFCICLSRDRGDMMVDVGVDLNHMQKLENAIEIITGDTLKEPVPLATLAAYTQNNWPALIQGFSDSAWVNALSDYGKRKAEVWYENLSNKAPDL